MLSTSLLVNCGLLVVEFWGSQKLYMEPELIMPTIYFLSVDKEDQRDTYCPLLVLFIERNTPYSHTLFLSLPSEKSLIVDRFAQSWGKGTRPAVSVLPTLGDSVVYRNSSSFLLPCAWWEALRLQSVGTWACELRQWAKPDSSLCQSWKHFNLICRAPVTLSGTFYLRVGLDCYILNLF